MILETSFIAFIIVVVIVLYGIVSGDLRTKEDFKLLGLVFLYFIIGLSLVIAVSRLIKIM